jgi:hypothetical protein
MAYTVRASLATRRLLTLRLLNASTAWLCGLKDPPGTVFAAAALGGTGGSLAVLDGEPTSCGADAGVTTLDEIELTASLLGLEFCSAMTSLGGGRSSVCDGGSGLLKRSKLRFAAALAGTPAGGELGANITKLSLLSSCDDCPIAAARGVADCESSSDPLSPCMRYGVNGDGAWLRPRSRDGRIGGGGTTAASVSCKLLLTPEEARGRRAHGDPAELLAQGDRLTPALDVPRRKRRKCCA